MTKTAANVEAIEYAGATEDTATAVESKRLSSSWRRVGPSSRSGTGAPNGPLTSFTDILPPSCELLLLGFG
jgi:hypothetical protein